MERATSLETQSTRQILNLDFLKGVVIKLWLVLFPFFFLPITSDFFSFNKLALTTITALILLLLSTIEFIFNKKIKWGSNSLESYLLLLIFSSSLSLIISSPNKVQALIYSNYSPLMLFSLSIIAYYLVKLKIDARPYILFSAFLLSISALFFFFNPLKNASLPNNLNFLKNPYFTPTGSYLSLLVFLAFAIGWQSINLFVRKKEKKDLAGSFMLLFILVGFLTAAYNLLKPQTINGQKFQLLLPPFRLSWYAAVEILKKPLTAVFGIGPDNYAAIFTRVKDIAYNQSNLWQISYFNFARNFVFHIFTVGGILGFISLALIYLKLLREAKEKDKEVYYLLLFFLAIMFFVPPSIILWGILFILISHTIIKTQKLNEVSIDLSNLLPVYAAAGILSLLFIGGVGFFLGRAYAAEVYFKKALDGLQRNDAQTVYENHRKAIQYNPYVERFRISFSQLNLVLANNFLKQLLDEQKDKKPDQQKINNLRQSVTQAIQAAINEAKAAAALNPQKASNWANLAAVYRNIINLAQNADVWTITAYQRAIQIDPQNPIYRLNLGGVHFSLGQYEQALRLFEQAVALKPDWANAHYNLAWAAYNTKDYQRAVLEMQNVLNLLDPKKAKGDYERAKKDLEQFKKKLEETKKATGPATLSPTPTPTPSQLSLPTPVPTIKEKINLPKEASPEAR